jgi:hypothetical protein
MTAIQGEGPVSSAFSAALGHVRNASEDILADGQTGETLLSGLDCLELQGMFGDVWPDCIPNDRPAHESLACAEALLGEVSDDVPLALWVALRSLRHRVGDGHR